MKKRNNKTALKPFLIVLACVLTIPLVLGLFSMGDGTNSPSGGGGGGSTSGGGNNSSTDSGAKGEYDEAVTHTLAASIDETWITSLQEKGQEQSDGSRLFCKGDGFSISLKYFQEQPMISVMDGDKTYNYVNQTTATSLGITEVGWMDLLSMKHVSAVIGISMPEDTVLYLDDWSELDPLFE